MGKSRILTVSQDTKRNDLSDATTQICAFFSHAISQDGIITDNSDAECYITSVMIEQARNSVYLCDESKANRSSLYNLTTVDKIHKVFTTASPESFTNVPEDKMVYISFNKN